MIYVYAVIEPLVLPLPAVAGLERQPLEHAAAGDVAAALTRHASGHLPATAENVWQHESVVEALMAKGAVLPARFGTSFPGERELGDALARHAGVLASGLSRVRGCVELGVRALWHSPIPSAPPTALDVGRAPMSGRDYMTARLAEERQRRDREANATRLCDAIHAALASEARESTRRALASPEVLMTAAYLVPVEQVPPFRSRMRAVGEANPTLRLLCTGPWPPYHFAPALGAALGSTLASALATAVTPSEAQNVRP